MKRSTVPLPLFGLVAVAVIGSRVIFGQIAREPMQARSRTVDISSGR